jgi:hypothetical protein
MKTILKVQSITLILLLLCSVCINPVSAQLHLVLEPLAEAGPVVVEGISGYVYAVLAGAGATVVGYIMTSQPQSHDGSSLDTPSRNAITNAFFDNPGWFGDSLGKFQNQLDIHCNVILLKLYGKNSAEIQQLLLVKDYNDAKDKGTPTKNHDDRTIGEKDENGKVIRSLEVVGTAYSSQQLFSDATDKQNGCPKQIRYYGKDGKAEMDIDFYHGESKSGTHPYPHKHTWENNVRSDWIKDTKLEELFKHNKCKNYDYENHRFK